MASKHYPKLRNSNIELNKLYFWTDTIKDWNHLFKADQYKQIVIDSLCYLSNNKLTKIYAFVIMPNHLHIVWKMIKMNGKELPHASFNKFVSHRILIDLKSSNKRALSKFLVDESTRKHRFWQRDALAIELEYESKAFQKVTYIHNNPLQPQWNLVTRPEDYNWSSAYFYETNLDKFGFLIHVKEAFE